MADIDNNWTDSVGATPVYTRTECELKWPTDKVFFLMASNGLFRCRNHEFFTSCTPFRGFPLEYGSYDQFLKMRFPIIPRRLFELVVGFFGRVQALHNSEAIVLLAWNRLSRRYDIVVPRQIAVVAHSKSRDPIPVSVKYEVPEVPPESTILVSIHSHADHSAFASAMDVWDEQYRAGVHIVVGRVDREPPEYRIEAVVDGCRFRVDPGLILGGYEKRRAKVPAEWLQQLRLQTEDPYFLQSHLPSPAPQETRPCGSKKQTEPDHESDRGASRSLCDRADQERAP